MRFHPGRCTRIASLRCHPAHAAHSFNKLPAQPLGFGVRLPVHQVECQRLRRGVSTDTSDGHAVMLHIAERSTQPFSKYSLQELLQLQELSPEQRLEHLDGVLHVGISKIILLLRDLPLGFGAQASIRDVIADYVQDIRDLRASSPAAPEEYRDCILTIFARHRGMLRQIARGLQEFQQEITQCYEPVGTLSETECADISETVPALKKIETTLDQFFTIRTTLRMLITHCVQLNPEDRQRSLGLAIHELLQTIPGRCEDDQSHIGAICLQTRPSLILVEAFRHAHYTCMQRYARAPELFVNGLSADEFLQLPECPFEEARFPYVDIHLYFIFYEVLKTALLTSIRKVGLTDEQPPAIHASLISGTSLTMENERTVKITDHGEGIGRNDVRKVWSYFHSTSPKAAPRLTRGRSVDVEGHSPNAMDKEGRGLGLALSRVLVRYFGGEIDLHSIPRKGTDVYIYL